MEPIICGRTIGECIVAGQTLKNNIKKRISKYFTNSESIFIRDDFWPSLELLEKISKCTTPFKVLNNDQEALLWKENSDLSQIQNDNVFNIDKNSFQITYPWELLNINEELMKCIQNPIINGNVRNEAIIDGILQIGKNSVLLPGVYIEGTVIIGENCKIGPNCYIRGFTSIGDNCHIGQAVEIKNSILMNNVAAGHLSYIGDSIIGEHTNFGAGTITANFRHDGKNHISAINNELINTGRRKFGTVFGDNVHTGIHTSIYPGRKIWNDKSTLPGTIVKKDIKPRKK
jgi:bifunctional UDP-N-acetylglucosamine pyrophosphorylase/glucosamine-1-phosphate N-acetyltransferase